MHSEDEFQAHLDDHPDDHAARMIFADWLDEQGDLRGPGYRAMGVNQIVGCDNYSDAKGFFTHWAKGEKSSWFKIDSRKWKQLPRDWYDCLKLVTPKRAVEDGQWYVNDCRADAESAAALAFSRLPADRQAELLTPASASQPATAE